jgi:hypothetical protein
MRGRLNSQSGADSYNYRAYGTDNSGNEEADLQRAIEESKRTAAEEEARRGVRNNALNSPIENDEYQHAPKGNESYVIISSYKSSF